MTKIFAEDLKVARAIDIPAYKNKVKFLSYS